MFYEIMRKPRLAAIVFETLAAAFNNETAARGRSRIGYFRGDAKKYPAWVFDCRLWAIDRDSDGVYDNLGGFFESFVDPILAGRPVATLVPPERVRPRGQPAGAAPKMSWVYAPDVVDAVLAAHAAGAAAYGEVFHVAHVARVTVADMAEVVACVEIKSST